jgi:hypothetical protein
VRHVDVFTTLGLDEVMEAILVDGDEVGFVIPEVVGGVGVPEPG